VVRAQPPGMGRPRGANTRGAAETPAGGGGGEVGSLSQRLSRIGIEFKSGLSPPPISPLTNKCAPWKPRAPAMAPAFPRSSPCPPPIAGADGPSKRASRGKSASVSTIPCWLLTSLRVLRSGRLLFKGSDFVSVVLEGGAVYAGTQGELFCFPATGRIHWQIP